MYFISLQLNTSCSTEFKKQLMERGFHIAIVGKLSLTRTDVVSPNILLLSGESCYLDCVANLKGDHNFPDLEMLKFLFDHRDEIEDYSIGPLPF